MRRVLIGEGGMRVNHGAGQLQVMVGIRHLRCNRHGA